MAILIADNARVTFGETLRIYRSRVGISQQELADKAGVSRNYISLIERDMASNLSLGVLIRVAEAANTKLDISFKQKDGASTGESRTE